VKKLRYRIVILLSFSLAASVIHPHKISKIAGKELDHRLAYELKPLNQDKQSPSSQQTELVRRGIGFCPEEMRALYSRYEYNNKALQNFLNREISLKDTPLIGIACSGGGNRAAVAALGLYKGLEKIGLLDCVTYMASLSGSTWSTAAWLTHDYSLDKLEEYLKYKLNEALCNTKINQEVIALQLVSKIFSGRPVTLNDIWGGLLANIYLDNGNNNYGLQSYLADISDNVSDEKRPLPIFTAVIDETSPYEWAEFTPFEIGSPYLNTWIKPSAFGKEFNQGISTDKAREENLGYILGLCGSAYALNISDLLNVARDFFLDRYYLSIPAMCYSWLTSFWWGQRRISPPRIHNFCRYIPNTPFSDKKRLTFVDAGLSINIPIPPLLRRNVDLYIVCDAGSDALYSGNHALKQTADYAKQNGFPFPQNINYKEIVKEKISIIVDQNDPTLPIIIYIPNFFYVSLLDFDYSEEEFNGLLHGIENAVVDNKEKIKSAVQLSIYRMSKNLQQKLNLEHQPENIKIAQA